MNMMIAGLVLFFATHLAPNTGNIREPLVAKNEKLYMLGYALLSLAGIVLASIGRANAKFVHVWLPPQWRSIRHHFLW